MIKCLLTFTSVLGMACIIAYTYFIWCCILKMDKLIELLLEYDSWLYAMLRIKQNINWTDILEIFDSLNFLQNFVKWLVKKNKIDKEKFNYCRDNFFDERYFGYWTHEYIIMMLAIQDNPIEFLIGILK